MSPSYNGEAYYADPNDSYSAGKQLQLQTEKCYDHDLPADKTCFPVLRISFDDKDASLKLFDRRFCPAITLKHGVNPWDGAREAKFAVFVRTDVSKAILDNDLDEDEREATSEVEAKGDSVHKKCLQQYQIGVRTYEQLQPMQDLGQILKLRREYYSVPRVTLESISNSVRSRSLTLKHGIPIELWGPIATSALFLVADYGRLGILNHDIWLANVLIRKGDHTVVIIDFAMSEFEEDFTSWEKWMLAKAKSNKEGP
ncbi:MAG: hypothetical protein MMC33_008317 [Icmadophila ericetorum]|nr:hypothetical protein [Icmadophila ericetorum]